MEDSDNNQVNREKRQVKDTPYHAYMRRRTKEIRQEKINKYGIDEVRCQEKYKKRFQVRRKKLEKEGKDIEIKVSEDIIFENVLNDIISSNKNTLREYTQLIYNLFILLFNPYEEFDIKFLLDKERVDNYIRNSDISIKSKYHYFKSIVFVIRRYDGMLDDEDGNCLASTLDFYKNRLDEFKRLLES